MKSEKSVDMSQVGLLSSRMDGQFAHENSEMIRNSASLKRKYHVLIALLLLAIGLLLATIIIQTYRLPHSSENYPTRDCGNSSAEAQANGCVFDLMNFAWQPPECFDRGLSEQYLARAQRHGPLRWYKDANKSIELPNEVEVLSDYKTLWAEHRYHTVHCLYGWDLLHRGIDEDRPVIEFLVDIEHTKHCASVVAVEVDIETQAKVDTDVKTWFQGCVKLTR